MDKHMLILLFKTSPSSVLQATPQVWQNSPCAPFLLLPAAPPAPSPAIAIAIAIIIAIAIAIRIVHRHSHLLHLRLLLLGKTAGQLLTPIITITIFFVALAFLLPKSYWAEKHLASMLWTLIFLSRQSEHWGAVITRAPALEAVVWIFPLLPLPFSLAATGNGFLTSGYPMLWVASTIWGLEEATAVVTVGGIRLVMVGVRWRSNLISNLFKQWW